MKKYILDFLVNILGSCVLFALVAGTLPSSYTNVVVSLSQDYVYAKEIALLIFMFALIIVIYIFKFVVDYPLPNFSKVVQEKCEK